MIIMILKDGLGNQLFEYAYVKKLQEQSGDKKIAICTLLYRLKNFSLDGTRQCSLHHFALDDNTIILRGLPNLLAFLGFVWRLFIVYKLDFVNWFLKKNRIPRGEKYVSDCKKGVYVTQGAFCVPPYVHCMRKNKYVFGNYEGFMALPSDKIAMRNALQISAEQSAENRKMLEKIQGCEAVCIHIRRGDYLNNANERLQVCDFDYYLRGVKYMQSEVVDPTFFVFSNSHEDIEWIKRNYNFGLNLEYVDLSNPDYEELRLMASCKHFILSNSTFSWWATQICSNPMKKVYAPSIWSKKDVESRGMLLDDFIIDEIR